MLDLSKDELLVLFEFCHRICETSKIAASHPAEVAILDKLAGQLERSLAELFDPTYPTILNDARKGVLDAYREKMGENSWIETVPLEQV